MRTRCPILVLIFAASGLLVGQTGKQAPAESAAASAERALKLAEEGRCQEALPLLVRAVPRLTDKQLLYHAAMGQTRCAMAREDSQAAVSALMLLKREFSNDPEVLYICVHYFSELATRASHELAGQGAHVLPGAPPGSRGLRIARQVG